LGRRVLELLDGPDKRKRDHSERHSREGGPKKKAAFPVEADAIQYARSVPTG
jgi:hypothetical protein